MIGPAESGGGVKTRESEKSRDSRHEKKTSLDPVGCGIKEKKVKKKKK